MATITLPSDVILDVLKFVPYENATKLVLTSKSWAKPLQIQLKEQRIAIIAELRRLESIDLEKHEREIKSTWHGLVLDEKQLCADLKTNVFNANGAHEQTAAIALFNQRLQAVQDNKNAIHDQYCAIARKRQPIIDKIENLDSKLGQCGESETERIADLKRRLECCSEKINLLGYFATIVLAISSGVLVAFIVTVFNDRHQFTLNSYICLIVSFIIFVVVLPLWFFIDRKLESLRNHLSNKLKLKVDCYENRKYVN